MAGNTTRIIPVQWHSNHPLYLRSLYLLPCHNTRLQGHNYPHSTSSQSRIWAIHWATGKAWNTSTTMRLNPPSLWRSCDKHACNNCARSACVVNNSVCSQLSQVLQASFNAIHPARLLERRCTCNPPLNPPVTQACYKRRVSARRLSFSQAHSSPAAYSACSAPRCSPTFSVQPVPPMPITRRFLYPTSSSPSSLAERSVRPSSPSSRTTW